MSNTQKANSTYYYNIDSRYALMAKKTEAYLFEQLLKSFSKGRRYLIEGEWCDSQKISELAAEKKQSISFDNYKSSKEYALAQKNGARSLKKRAQAIFNSVEDYKKAAKIFILYDKMFGDNDVKYPIIKKGKIINRIIDSIKNDKPLNIFIPWGMRVSWVSSDFDNKNIPESEKEVLKKVVETEKVFTQAGVATQFIFMGADIYATEVNSYPKEPVEKYFNMMSEEVKKQLPNAVFTTWSELINKSPDRYEELGQQYNEEKIKNILPPEQVMKAFEAAKRRSGFIDADSQKEASLRYLRERMIEAEFVEEMFSPIKMSIVPPQKDDNIDRDLPRVYLIPDEMRFPWLKNTGTNR